MTRYVIKGRPANAPFDVLMNHGVGDIVEGDELDKDVIRTLVGAGALEKVSEPKAETKKAEAETEKSEAKAESRPEEKATPKSEAKSDTATSKKEQHAETQPKSSGAKSR